MIARHTVTYVGTRAFAAALNMASVAVFTRLAPVEAYGQYLYILSWALVLYGATCQWPKFAFFALYDEGREAAQVGTVVRILGLTLLLAGAAGAAAVALGLASGEMAGAVVAAALGLTLYEGTTEIARTRLSVGAVALSVVLRAVLVLALGSLALHLSGDPVHLVLAVAAANVLASVPAGLTILPLVAGPGSLGEARRLLAYGWPLVISFGIAALAQTIDRIVIGRTVGPQDLGAYGAIADFLRQSFVVFGESIALSLVSIAKREARAGGMPAAERVLADAARAMALVAAFGAAFFLSFDDLVVTVLLGPGYRAEAIALAPTLIVASILMMFRAYYFGQIIYFTRTSRLDVAASLVMLVGVGGLSLLLIPVYGVAGAAVAYAVGQGLGCLAFVFGGRLRMPVPVADILGIAAIAAVTGGLAAALGLLQAGGTPLGQAARLALLVAGALAAAWQFNVVGLAESWRRRRAA
ncbi:lipopolysaccharide biosynthesis protein [Methylobacterium sp. A54F]